MRIYIILVLLSAGLGIASAQTSSPTASRDVTIEEVPAVATALARIDAYLNEESALGRRRVELLSLVAAREMNLA